MQPLRITIRLRTPMVISAPTHFDAVLAHAAFINATKNGFDTAGALEESNNLPLARWTCQQTGSWGHKASVLIPDFSKADSKAVLFAMTRKPEYHIFARFVKEGFVTSARKTYPMGTGKHKLYQLFVPTRHVEFLTAYMIAEPERVYELMGCIGYIGPKRRNGYGAIDSYKLEVDDAAESMWEIRNLPLGFTRKHNSFKFFPAQGGIRAPYWKTTLHRMVSMPMLSSTD